MPWPTEIEHPDSIRRARLKIKDRTSPYRRIQDRLLLTVNVYSRGFNPLAHAKNTLFGNGGIWGPSISQYPNPIAVILFGNTDVVNVHMAGGCLYVNPSVDPTTLPPALLRLPYAHGPGASKRRRRQFRRQHPGARLTARPVARETSAAGL